MKALYSSWLCAGGQQDHLENQNKSNRNHVFVCIHLFGSLFYENTIMPMKIMKPKWEPLRLDEKIFSNGAPSVEGLIGIEVLNDYEDVEVFRGSKRRKKKTSECETVNKETPTKKIKKSTPSNKEEGLQSKKTKLGKKKLKDKKVEPKGWSVSVVNEESSTGHTFDFNTADMSAWRDLFVPPPVLEALAELHFTDPTQIQALTLPSAIMGNRDILGAAETGSGKTLAFGIPIIHGILKYQERVNTGLEVEEAVEESEESEEEIDEDADIGCVKVIPMGLAKNSNLQQNRKLHALILTPTRELAIQVKNHLIAVTKHCHIKVATVVGGLSQEKQERVLSKGPEIVVATPGRLWELIKEGNPHLQQVDTLRYLVIDEADRMMEKGHFQELQELLERMLTLRTKKPQTLVFSATLTLVHEAPSRLRHKGGKGKKKVLKQTPGQKLQQLIMMLGMDKPKVVDVTAKQCTAENLTEAYIPCALEDKDAQLYCFLQSHPGRTLVFCNSVTCVRRLMQLFTLLQCKPVALHAQMQQRQRLKSLDRFSGDPKGLLLATDVAARGLDIPGVQHVIHYQVPRTSESYIHRSGRTARASSEGLTVLFVEPKEMPLYSRLCRTLGRDRELPEFPVDSAVFKAVQERVHAARQLEALEHTQRRVNAEESWLSKAATDLDLHFDQYDKLPVKGHIDPDATRDVAARKKHLQALLKQRLVLNGHSFKYPTSTGSLQVPFASDSKEDPIKLVKSAKPGDKRSLGTSLGIFQDKKKRPKFKKKKKKSKSAQE